LSREHRHAHVTDTDQDPKAAGKPKKKPARKDARVAELTAKVDSLEKELEKVSREARENHENWLRALADFENYRKRTEREWSKRVKEAGEELIVRLLPVLDSFERAFDAGEESDDDPSFREGMRLVYRQLKSVLENCGVSVVDPVGEAFDPALHEALMQVDSGEHPSEHVVQVLEKGYRLGEKVLRPAKVSVAK